MARILVLSSNPKGDLKLNREIDDLTAAIERFGTLEVKRWLIVQRTVPNQGIRTSLRNCLFIGLIVGLSFGLISALKYGGVACIQHFSLRRMLHQKGRIPQNYAKFLNFISERRLMKRVGGGYVFFHRMLLEHFARMDPN